jgi:hypothetical protein
MAKLIATGIDADDGSETLVHQIFAFFGHTLIALAIWAAMMLVGYIINPAYIPQIVISAFSFLVPLVTGAIITGAKPSEIAPHVWLAGIIWLLFLSLWLLDLPAGPNACNQCVPIEKILRSFFSYPAPSGLIDDNGPFFGTWPPMATIGYAVGAGLVQSRRKKQAE